MMILRSINGSTIALPANQSLWVHRARYDESYSFLAESFQVGQDNGYFKQPIGLSDGDIITYDQKTGQIRVNTYEQYDL